MRMSRSFVFKKFVTISTRNWFLFKMSSFYVSSAIAAVVKSLPTSDTTILFHGREDGIVSEWLNKFSRIWENKQVYAMPWSPWIVLKWWPRDFLFFNILPHSEQLTCCWTPLWMDRMCLLASPFSENVFPQKVHWLPAFVTKIQSSG